MAKKMNDRERTAAVKNAKARKSAKNWQKQMKGNTGRALNEAIKTAQHNERMELGKMDNRGNRLGNADTRRKESLKEVRSAHRDMKRRPLRKQGRK